MGAACGEVERWLLVVDLHGRSMDTLTFFFTTGSTLLFEIVLLADYAQDVILRGDLVGSDRSRRVLDAEGILFLALTRCGRERQEWAATCRAVCLMRRTMIK